MLKIDGNITKTVSGELSCGCHKTVLDIERLLHWVYQEQRADDVDAATVARPGAVGSNCRALMRHAALGTAIDGGGYAANDLHPDAEAAHAAVLSLPPLELGLVVEFARSGLRPDWLEDETVRPVKVLNRDGQPAMEYWDDRCRNPAFCLLRYDPEPAHVEFVRGVYITWWDALARLGERLEDLESYRVVGPDFPREPWLNNRVDTADKT